MPSAGDRLALIAFQRFNDAFGGFFIMRFRRLFRRSIVLTAAFASLAAFAVSPARADRCEESANQLKSEIDGLTVDKTAAGVIYLSHPQAKQLTLGCASKNLTGQLYARSDGRKPKPAFLDLVAGAAAIVFTLPKDEMQKAASRCMRALGLFRNDVSIHFHQLEMRCIRSKTDASIAISRRVDQ